MKRWLTGIVALGFTAVALLPLSAAERRGAVETIDAFIKAVKENKELPADKVESAVAVAEELKADPPSHSAVITVALRELYPDYAAALVDMADENLAAATEKLEKLSASADPYLATDATFFLARARMLEERFEEALPLLQKVQGESAPYSLQHADTMFLTGLCQARLIQRKEAIETFTRFEEQFPDAPERMRIGAWRMLQQLQLMQDGTIVDVQDRMDFSRRKLALQDPGKATQQEQQKIVDILAKLIKEAEERECNCQGGGSGEGRQKSSGQNSGQADGNGQSGNKGGHGQGDDNSQKTDELTRLRRSGPESGWSKLREREREQVFSAIKQKYPARYEKLVEQYYKSFQEGK